MAKEGASKYRNGSELKSAVERDGHLLTVSMEDIRRAHGQYGKLGVHVQPLLARWLKGEGLGALPPELKRYQNEEVRLYKLATPMADVVEAVLDPSEAGDTELRRYVSANGEAQRQLDEIRAVLGE